MDLDKPWSKLLFLDRSPWSDAWVPFPRWALFYSELGYRMAESAEQGVRGVVGVALPTRAFAATIAAVSIVLARSEVAVDDLTKSRHFERLCSLPKGTSTTLRVGNKKVKGVFVGTATKFGILCVGVQVQAKKAGGLTHWLPAPSAAKIEVAPSEVGNLPKRQSGSRILKGGKFVQLMLGNVDAYEFASRSRLECAVLGRIGMLRDEIRGTEFGFGGRSDGADRGTFQEILRVRRFGSSAQSFRSRVLPVDGRTPQTADGSTPAVTIFDGATGYLKWRDHWRQSNWIVLLDRTESRFDEAVGVFNEEYIQNRVDDRPVDDCPVAPAGVETVFYWEARR